MRILKTLLLFLFLLGAKESFSQADQPPFWDEIQAFKKEDSLRFPPTNQILFVGSSSFRMWKDVQSAFPDYPIINRGFGGSSLPDVIRYADDIIFPYQPKQIVIYCGENDIASSDTVSAEMVYERFKTLFSNIRNKLPDVPVVYVSMKPSPSRWQMKDRMIEGNERIKKYLEDQKGTKFIDVWDPMLKPDGRPQIDLFLEDQLHMNSKGYAIWQKAIKPYLKN